MYKKEKIDEAKTVSKAMKEDWLKNKNNQMEEFLTDIGAAAKDDLSKAKVASEMKRKFRGERKLFVVNLPTCEPSNSIFFSEKFLFD